MKRFIIVVAISIVSQVVVAQCKFSMTLSVNGCSNSLDGRIAEKTAEALFNHYMEQASMGFNSKQECDAAKNIVLSELDIRDGNCRIRVNVSPCTGCTGRNINSADILSIGQGSSFYSTNSVNEIRDWSNDDMERMLALNSDNNPQEPEMVATGDITFDNLIENMPYSDETFSGRMPRGSTYIEADANIVYIGQPVRGRGVLVPDDFTSKPFNYGLGVWSSDDLKPQNVDLKPVPNGIKTFDEEGWDLWRDGLRLGKDMGMFVYGLGEGVAASTVAAASILGDANINLWTELYKAKRKIDLDEAYEAPYNILTEAAVYWGGKEYAIVGNVLYNAWNSTVNDFVNLVCDDQKDKLKAKAIDEVRNKALTEEVSKKLPKTGNIVGLSNIAINSYEFGGKLVDYNNKKK